MLLRLSTKTFEGFQLRGVGPPKPYQLRKNRECFRAQVVLNFLYFPVYGLVVEPNELEKFRQSLVARFDMLGHLPSGRGQRKSAITLIIDETTPGQASDHVGNGRRAEVKRLGQIGNPGVTFLINQLLNPFQMIFGRLGPVGRRVFQIGIRRAHSRDSSKLPAGWRAAFNRTVSSFGGNS